MSLPFYGWRAVHCYHLKGAFTPSDYVTVTVTFTVGTFDVFDGNCDGQNGLHTHFACQRYGDGDGDESQGVDRPSGI